MKIHEPACFQDFVCIAGACPDTCCHGWEVVIDEDTRKRYEALDGALGEWIRSHLRVDEDGDTCMASLNGRCPMLMDDGLCVIQKNLGETALSRVCDRYPRFIHEFGGLTEQGISLSCPEACRLILETPFSIREYSTDAPPSLNDIDPDLYFTYLQGRKLAFCIAEEYAENIHGGMALILDFSEALEANRAQPEDILRLWESSDFRSSRLSELRPKRRGDFARLVSVYQGMEPLTERYPAMLATLTHCPPLPDNTVLLRILQYYIYKYFLQAAYDGKLLKKMQLAAASLLMLGALYAAYSPADRTAEIDLIHLYSRELEHSEPNLAHFFRSAGKHRQKLLNALLLS